MFVQFLMAHKTELSVASLWLFSALLSTMPPLPEKAGFMLTWAHGFLQAIAGNINKIHPQGASNVRPVQN